MDLGWGVLFTENCWMQAKPRGLFRHPANRKRVRMYKRLMMKHTKEELFYRRRNLKRTKLTVILHEFSVS